MDGRKIPMIYERFAAFSKWIHIVISVCRVLQNLLDTFKSVQECFRIDSFIVELHNENQACQNLIRALPELVYRIP